MTSAPPIRGQRKRGRPKGSTLRGRLSRVSEGVGSVAGQGGGASTSSTSSSASSTSSTSSATLHGASAGGSPGGSSGSPGGGGGSGAPVKRGRGRPRLLPLGPGHQGSRAPPALPLALGTTLNNPKTDENSQKPFGFYTTPATPIGLRKKGINKKDIRILLKLSAVLKT
ncbi:hypothetical protein O3P69_009344 [Scylla paramamosain]|uniref:Uncharacterized protein n=1 Tax=Scylla paramamosain TaxID=85552 RepID=A0AAW0T9Y8_SCYPA